MPKGIYKRVKPSYRKGIIGVYKCSEETKEKISKSHLGQNTWSKGRKPSEETRKKLRLAMKKRIAEGKHNFYIDGRTSNRAYINWRAHKNHRLKRSAEGNHTFGDWVNLKARYNWTCPCCKKKEPDIKLAEDHIVPLTKGGSNNIENIQPLCKSCNSKKNNWFIIKYSKTEVT